MSFKLKSNCLYVLYCQNIQTVVFINGCFWHGNKGCKYYKRPKSKVVFWNYKIWRNKENVLLYETMRDYKSMVAKRHYFSITITSNGH